MRGSRALTFSLTLMAEWIAAAALGDHWGDLAGLCAFKVVRRVDAKVVRRLAQGAP
jgi:hypothetical protein